MRALERINALATRHSIPVLDLAGLNIDGEDVTLTYCLTLDNINNKKSRSYAQVENALEFMESLFLQMFDYHPCYTSEPTASEKDQARDFLSSLEKLPTSPQHAENQEDAHALHH